MKEKRLCDRCNKETKIVTITKNGLEEFSDSKEYPENHLNKKPFYWEVCQDCYDELFQDRVKKVNWDKKEKQIIEEYELKIEKLNSHYHKLFGKIYIKI